MRCLYVGSRSDSALIRSLVESGLILRVVPPAEAAWAREEGPFSVVVYEYSADSQSYFSNTVSGHGATTAVLAILAEDDDKLRAELLRAGADYCLSQPVSVFEVEAVLHSFFRWQRRQSDFAISPTVSALMPVKLNLRNRQATWQGKVLSLSDREISLLHVLMRSAGAAMDRATLWREIWGEGVEFNPQAIDLAISRLRRKLKGSPVVIVNLRAYGYRLSGDFEFV